MGEAFEAEPPDDVVDALFRQEREDRLADRCAVHGIAGPDTRNHAHGAAGLDLVDVDDARLLENAQVGRLLGFGHQAAQVRLGAFAQIVLLNRAIAEIEQPQAQPELAVGGALHHVVAFEHHQKAVRGALVKLQRGSDLRQAQRSLTFAEQIENRESAVQSLNLICALGGSVSHSGPLFR